MEEKQQRVEHYENMQISAVLQPYPGDHTTNQSHSQPAKSSSSNASCGSSGTTAAAAAAVGLDASDLELALTSMTSNTAGSSELQHCLVCVARRIPTTEKMAPSTTALTGGPVVEQFTTKLESSGRILAVDATGVSPPYSSYLSRETLVSTCIQELCHPDDLPVLTSHLNDTIQSGFSLSSRYRLRLVRHGSAGAAMTSSNNNNHQPFVVVQTKSKRFVNADTHATDFIMATHSIIDEEQDEEESDGHGRVASALAGSDLLNESICKSEALSPPLVPVMHATGGNPVLTSVTHRHGHHVEMSASSEFGLTAVSHRRSSTSTMVTGTTTSSTSVYSSTFAGLNLGTSSSDLLNDFVVPDLFMASPPWEFHHHSESSLDGSAGIVGPVVSTASLTNNSATSTSSAQMTSSPLHLPPGGSSSNSSLGSNNNISGNNSGLLRLPSPVSLIPSAGGPLLAGHSSHSVGIINWGSPPPSAAGSQQQRSASGSSGGPGAMVSTPGGPSNSRPSSRQSASSTPRPPSVVSPAFSPAPNSVLGVVHPSPVLSPVGSGGGGGNMMLASTSVQSTTTVTPSLVGQQQPSPASMTTPFSKNFPFSPLQDPIASAPLPASTATGTGPNTPHYLVDNDSKEGILASSCTSHSVGHGLTITSAGSSSTSTSAATVSSSAGHYQQTGTTDHKQQQQTLTTGSNNSHSALSSLLNQGDSATSSSSSVNESGWLRNLLMKKTGGPPPLVLQSSSDDHQQLGSINNGQNHMMLANLMESDVGAMVSGTDSEDHHHSATSSNTSSCGLGFLIGGKSNSGGGSSSHDNYILKGLLDQDDEVDRDRCHPTGGSGSKTSSTGGGNAGGFATAAANNNNSSNHNNNNNMLHNLLNVRSDDDAEERFDYRKSNELLMKLLNNSDEDRHQSKAASSSSSSTSCSTNTASGPQGQQPSSATTPSGVIPASTTSYQEEQLLKSLGFPSPSSTSSGSLSSILGANHSQPSGHLKSPGFFYISFH